MTLTLKTFLTAFVATSLMACGGGGGDGSTLTKTNADLYGRVTLNYFSLTNNAKIYTASADFSAASTQPYPYQAQIHAAVLGSPNRTMACQAYSQPTAAFPYSCVVMTGNSAVGTELFFFNMNNSYNFDGVYEYCESGDIAACAQKIKSNPDGAVSGKVTKTPMGMAAPITGASAAPASANLPLEQALSEMVSRLEKSVNPQAAPASH